MSESGLQERIQPNHYTILYQGVIAECRCEEIEQMLFAPRGLERARTQGTEKILKDVIEIYHHLQRIYKSIQNSEERGESPGQELTRRFSSLYHNLLELKEEHGDTITEFLKVDNDAVSAASGSEGEVVPRRIDAEPLQVLEQFRVKVAEYKERYVNVAQKTYNGQSFSEFAPEAQRTAEVIFAWLTNADRAVSEFCANERDGKLCAEIIENRTRRGGELLAQLEKLLTSFELLVMVGEEKKDPKQEGGDISVTDTIFERHGAVTLRVKIIEKRNEWKAVKESMQQAKRRYEAALRAQYENDNFDLDDREVAEWRDEYRKLRVQYATLIREIVSLRKNEQTSLNQVAPLAAEESSDVPLAKRPSDYSSERSLSHSFVRRLVLDVKAREVMIKKEVVASRRPKALRLVTGVINKLQQSITEKVAGMDEATRTRVRWTARGLGLLTVSGLAAMAAPAAAGAAAASAAGWWAARLTAGTAAGATLGSIAAKIFTPKVTKAAAALATEKDKAAVLFDGELTTGALEAQEEVLAQAQMTHDKELKKRRRFVIGASVAGGVLGGGGMQALEHLAVPTAFEPSATPGAPYKVEASQSVSARLADAYTVPPPPPVAEPIPAPSSPPEITVTLPNSDAPALQRDVVFPHVNHLPEVVTPELTELQPVPRFEEPELTQFVSPSLTAVPSVPEPVVVSSPTAPHVPAPFLEPTITEAPGQRLNIPPVLQDSVSEVVPRSLINLPPPVPAPESVDPFRSVNVPEPLATAEPFEALPYSAVPSDVPGVPEPQPTLNRGAELAIPALPVAISEEMTGAKTATPPVLPEGAEQGIGTNFSSAYSERLLDVTLEHRRRGMTGIIDQVLRDNPEITRNFSPVQRDMVREEVIRQLRANPDLAKSVGISSGRVDLIIAGKDQIKLHELLNMASERAEGIRTRAGITAAMPPVAPEMAATTPTTPDYRVNVTLDRSSVPHGGAAFERSLETVIPEPQLSQESVVSSPTRSLRPGVPESVGSEPPAPTAPVNSPEFGSGVENTPQPLSSPEAELPPESPAETLNPDEVIEYPYGEVITNINNAPSEELVSGFSTSRKLMPSVEDGAGPVKLSPSPELVERMQPPVPAEPALSEVPEVLKRVRIAPGSSDLSSAAFAEAAEEMYGSAEAYTEALSQYVERIDSAALGLWERIIGNKVDTFTKISDVTVADMQKVATMPRPQLREVLVQEGIPERSFAAWRREIDVMKNAFKEQGLSVDSSLSIRDLVNQYVLRFPLKVK